MVEEQTDEGSGKRHERTNGSAAAAEWSSEHERRRSAHRCRVVSNKKHVVQVYIVSTCNSHSNVAARVLGGQLFPVSRGKNFRL